MWWHPDHWWAADNIRDTAGGGLKKQWGTFNVLVNKVSI
jgi:hypothetical protein